MGFLTILMDNPKSYLRYIAEGISHFTEVRQSFPCKDSNFTLGPLIRSAPLISTCSPPLPAAICLDIARCYH